MEQPIRRIPYGLSNFITVRTENNYYVDKTMFLPQLEDTDRFLFFIRPRRFGKSLFIDMMQCYYDKFYASRFDELFSGLWIHDHPTSLQGKFHVLRLDFSCVGSNLDHLREDFDTYCCDSIDAFMDKYGSEYPAHVVDRIYKSGDAKQKLNILNAAAKQQGIPLYLIIDEYDNFTNVILSQRREDLYHAITHADGFYRDIFKLFKPMFSRIFLTGVSPVTLDDLTSGFNIASNISMDPAFNDMLGFSTEDVREMLTYYKEVGYLPEACDVEQTLDRMKPWYDNYCFAADCLQRESRMFNSDMVLYYINQYRKLKHEPDSMVDPNTGTDYAKMKQILQLNGLDENGLDIIQQITEAGEIMGEVYTSFPAEALANKDIYLSLLLYYGMLTLRRKEGEVMVLGIPNNNVRKQYYKYLLDHYQHINEALLFNIRPLFTPMAFEGKWQPLLQAIANAYRDMTAVRSSMEGERHIQGFFLAFLSLTTYYLTAPELELSHGYCDFFLLPDLTHYATHHSYIVELKYLPKKDYAQKAEAQWQEATEQIRRYAQAPRVQQLRQGTQLHKIIMQFEGWELKRMEEID